MPQISSGGSTVGSAQIVDNEIINADVNTAANIAISKLATGPMTKLATATLGADATTLSSGTITAKKHLHVVMYCAGNATADLGIQFNGDTAANYEWVVTKDGAAVTSNAADSKIKFGSGSETEVSLVEFDIYNASATVKMVSGIRTTGHEVYTFSGKWTNTAAQITSIVAMLDSAGNILSGSYIEVWGRD